MATARATIAYSQYTLLWWYKACSGYCYDYLVFFRLLSSFSISSIFNMLFVDYIKMNFDDLSRTRSSLFAICPFSLAHFRLRIPHVVEWQNIKLTSNERIFSLTFFECFNS